MTYPLASSMKLKPKTSSTPAPTSDEIPRERLCTAVMYVLKDGTSLMAFSPKPPTAEAIKRAQFVDKTYVWVRK